MNPTSSELLRPRTCLLFDSTAVSKTSFLSVVGANRRCRNLKSATGRGQFSPNQPPVAASAGAAPVSAGEPLSVGVVVMPASKVGRPALQIMLPRTLMHVWPDVVQSVSVAQS
jgi:hypothetical protein